MSDYCPGAVQSPQPGGGGLNASLPARAVWHITWDALRPDGSQPEFSAVSDYLKRVAYYPTIMWNPFTGYIEQYIPASQSARALVAWNEDGAVNIQVEAFFTPGCVVDGIKYATLADTPCVGLETILQWMDGFGIPRVWPMGTPQWQGNSRDVNIWNTQGGHYGHCNVPDNTHTDPGPMPSLTGTINTQGETTQTIQEDDMANVSDDQLDRLLRAADRVNGVITDEHAKVLTTNDIDDIADKVLDTAVPLAGGGTTTLKTKITFLKQEFNVNQNLIASVNAKVDALAGAVAQGSAASKEEILAQLDASVKASFDQYEPTLVKKESE